MAPRRKPLTLTRVNTELYLANTIVGRDKIPSRPAGVGLGIRQKKGERSSRIVYREDAGAVSSGARGRLREVRTKEENEVG